MSIDLQGIETRKQIELNGLTQEDLDLDDISTQEKYLTIDDNEKKLVELEALIFESSVPNIDEFGENSRNYFEIKSRWHNEIINRRYSKCKKDNRLDLPDWSGYTSNQLGITYDKDISDKEFESLILDMSSALGLRREEGRDKPFNFYEESKSKEELVEEIKFHRKWIAIVEKFGTANQKEKLIASLARVIFDTQEALAQAKGIEQNLAEIKRGEHYFSHGVPEEFIPNLLKTGLLASRKSQLEHFGYANLATGYYGAAGKTQVTPEGVVRDLDTGQIVEDPKHIIKSKQEQYQILFSYDSLYFKGGSHGLYIVFPAGLLLNNKMYLHDGVHIFDSKFDPKENQVGFEVNLQNIPHLIVASESQRDLVEQSIDEAFWIEDKDEYKGNVLYYPDDIFYEIPGEGEISIHERVSQDVKTKFEGNYELNGRFLLSQGQEIEETAFNIKRTHPLYSLV